ncbi:hypothetical protein ACFRMQ_38355 [Kitasatospora sp. NPDC056783]|uniref:hypothetical protein n=1 Tax=Kitasatospora sp. NPDC056783 TaxID=3345943 RepID=UPI0036B3B048
MQRDRARTKADGRLVAAVRARDAAAVGAALGAGADPSAVDTGGLPLLWTAVAGFDHEVAGLLVRQGADPDRPLPDGEALAVVLEALGGREHPEEEAIGLRHADHPDPRVRRAVPNRLGTPLTEAGHDCVLRPARDRDASVRSAVARSLGDGRRAPGTGAALLALARDASAEVQAAAACALAHGADRTPEVAGAPAALLGVDDRPVRLEAAHGLAARDDPRTALALALLGPPGGPEDEHDHRARAVWDWRFRNRPEGT